MNTKQQNKLSKLLSFVLRHKPEAINLQLDKQGWADTAELIDKLNANGNKISLETLENIVQHNDKKRFAFNEDKTKIRANQGHSLTIDLGYKEKIPPAFLYHGTASRFMESIKQLGLQKQNRHHVHLSDNVDTAIAVGKRYGKPVLLKILSGQMAKEGFAFYQADNGVWLTDAVPVKFIVEVEDNS